MMNLHSIITDNLILLTVIQHTTYKNRIQKLITNIVIYFIEIKVQITTRGNYNFNFILHKIYKLKKCNRV